jgi:hypothetical protein
MIFISTQMASTSSQIDFTTEFDGAYDAYEFRLTSVKFSVDNSYLAVRIFNPGLQAGGGYAWNLLNAGTATPSSSPGDTAIVISNDTISNAAGAKLSGKLELRDPETGDSCSMSADVAYDGSGSTTVRTISSGRYLPAGAVTGLRFFPSSGTFLSGRFSMYGIGRTAGADGQLGAAG